MGGIPGMWLVYFPAAFVLFALLGFPVAKLFLRGSLKKQKIGAGFFAAISIVLLLLYAFTFRFVGLYIQAPVLIPFIVLLTGASYFTYRFFKPGDFQNYQLGITYKIFVAVVAMVFIGSYTKSKFPSSDRKFISPDGKYEVLAYTGDNFGKTIFKLYDNTGKLLGSDWVESGGMPKRDSGATWFEDHVRLEYMCMKLDCQPAYLRLDGQKISNEDFSRFEKLWKKN